jgi:hypothetical protein
MVAAAIVMLVANRALPEAMADRAFWEKAAFWGAWLLAMAHAWWRTAPVRQARIAPAWREQCWAIAVLAVLAVLLNWATTGDHLVKTVFTQTYWPVAGLDLSLLVAAAIAAFAARRLLRREQGLGVGQRSAEAAVEDDEPIGLPGAVVTSKTALNPASST